MTNKFSKHHSLELIRALRRKHVIRFVLRMPAMPWFRISGAGFHHSFSIDLARLRVVAIHDQGFEEVSSGWTLLFIGEESYTPCLLSFTCRLLATWCISTDRRTRNTPQCLRDRSETCHNKVDMPSLPAESQNRPQFILRQDSTTRLDA